MKTVIIFSGGLDSTVLLHELLAGGDEVHALSVDYGQRHRRELEFARQTTERLHVPWEVADLHAIAHLLGGSSLTSADIAVPHGHYAEETMKATVVPNRNMIMLAVAGGWAISQKADRLAYGAHTGDHAIYPDCRPEFVQAIAHTLRLADWHPLELFTPFVGWTKSQIVQRGNELQVDFANTWSCYEGGTIHCGGCGTCFERREAFALAGISDPTEYAAHPQYPPPTSSS